MTDLAMAILGWPCTLPHMEPEASRMNSTEPLALAPAIPAISPDAPGEACGALTFGVDGSDVAVFPASGGTLKILSSICSSETFLSSTILLLMWLTILTGNVSFSAIHAVAAFFPWIVTEIRSQRYPSICSRPSRVLPYFWTMYLKAWNGFFTRFCGSLISFSSTIRREGTSTQVLPRDSSTMTLTSLESSRVEMR